MDNNLVLKNMMSFDELCKFADDYDGFSHVGGFADKEIIIYSLDDFLDLLDDEITAFEKLNETWKVKNARAQLNGQGNDLVLIPSTLRAERRLKVLWKYLNDEACVPADIGICLIKSSQSICQGVISDSVIATLSKNIKVKGGNGVSVYHNRATNKCTLKIWDGTIATVKCIWFNSDIRLGREYWCVSKRPDIPELIPDLGVLYETIINGNVFDKLVTMLNDKRVSAEDVNSYLTAWVTDYNKHFEQLAFKTYCPICGDACYLERSLWTISGGCNKHAHLFKRDYRGDYGYKYIDYVDGKFYIRSDKPSVNTIVWSEGKTFMLNALYMVNYLSNNALISGIKKCVECGETFAITVEYNNFLKTKGWKQPCKCAVCSGKQKGALTINAQGGDNYWRMKI